MQPDTYAFDDQPLIHEGIWKAASAIANAPMQMAQIKMDQEDRAQAQEDRRYRLVDRDRAHAAAKEAITYRDQKDVKALEKEKRDWISKRANDLVPKERREEGAGKAAYNQAVAEWDTLSGTTSSGAKAPPDAPGGTGANGGEKNPNVSILQNELGNIKANTANRPTPLAPGTSWTPKIARSGTSSAAPAAPHRIVMGVDIDEPAGIPYQPGSAMERGMLYDNSMIDTGATNYALAPQNAVVDGQWAGASGGFGGGTVADMNPPTRSTILNVADNVEGLPPPPIRPAPQVQNGQIPNQFNDSIPQFGTTMRPKIRMFDNISQQAYDVDAPLPAVPPARAGRGPLRMVQ